MQRCHKEHEHWYYAELRKAAMLELGELAA
jgi:hypothetical protein